MDEKDIYSNAELDAAIESLRHYAAGLSRGALVPIDAAVTTALPNPSARKALELRLLGILAGTPSHEAIDYICSKLALIGSEHSVAALGKLLAVDGASTAARNVLEKIPSTAASKSLRSAFVSGACADRVGVIQSLGRRRDSSVIPMLQKMLRESDVEIAAAAGYALGEIGSTKAGAALKGFLPHAPVRLRGALADALLVCAERLSNEGQTTAAKSLYSAVATGPFARHACEAAKNAAASISSSPAPVRASG